MASDAVYQFTEDNFDEEVLASNVPVLVDFWAEWCMPCRAIAPTIDALAAEFKGKAKVGKVDTDTNRELAVRYQIHSIPTILLFKRGEVIGKVQGLSPSVKKDLAAALNEAIGA